MDNSFAEEMFTNIFPDLKWNSPTFQFPGFHNHPDHSIM